MIKSTAAVSGPVRPAQYHTLTEYRRKLTVSAVAFRPRSALAGMLRRHIAAKKKEFWLIYMQHLIKAQTLNDIGDKISRRNGLNFRPVFVSACPSALAARAQPQDFYLNWETRHAGGRLATSSREVAFGVDVARTARPARVAGLLFNGALGGDRPRRGVRGPRPPPPLAP
ncbi:hypothetical protein EVAR_31745_1 [Eumeta japonica]|uniref:Uncharacterized protein n=1 Tax=Eumeta variegata TaxID=151549 RepID=A0A4C1W458_EUMVA|nr:hypothetical protein EVAR_31745_1 [Eumeta japonica]